MLIATPHRMASLCFISCLGLMIWNLIRRAVRRTLTERDIGLPYHRNKPSPRITTRFLFELYPKVQSQTIIVNGKCSRHLLGFDQWHKLAAEVIGTDLRMFTPVDPAEL